MFKIPSYEELEKKELDRNKDVKDYTSRIFQKRKQQDSASEVNPNTESCDVESPIKKVNKEPAPSKVVMNGAEQNVQMDTEPVIDGREDDEDDELLNNFIIENKDIIESGSQTTSGSGGKQPKSKEFLVPEVPVPVAFDPKVAVQRAQILQPNSTRY